MEKRKADIKFLRFCLIQLCPKFTNFKLRKSSRQCLTQVSALKKLSVTAEIKSHLRCVINSLESEFYAIDNGMSYNFETSLINNVSKYIGYIFYSKIQIQF